MNALRKMVAVLLMAAVPVLAFAQDKKIPQRLELAEVEVNDGEVELEVFNMPEDGQNHYYLSVGHLGFGDDIVQVNIDPLYELFIPLGDTVAESLEMMKKMQGLFKSPKGTYIEVPGCLALAFPNDQRETVKVTYRRPLVTRLLEFSVERNGYIRAAHINKAEFNSLVSSVKIYKKLHKKEP